MGKTKANTPPQSVVVRTDKSEGESGVYRCPEFKDNLVVTFDNVTSIPELLRYATEKFSNKNYLGYRQLYPDGTRGEFVWFTYKEVMEQSQHVSCGLVNLGAKPGDKIGFYSVNTYEWKLGEHACYLNSLAVVSLYDSLGPAAVDYIINHAEIEIIFCSNTVLPKLFAAFEKMENCKVRHVIVFDVSNRVNEFPAAERKRRQTISKEPPKEAPKKEEEKPDKQRRHTISFAGVPSFRREASTKNVKKADSKEQPKKEEKKEEAKKEESKKQEEPKKEVKKEEPKKEEPKKEEPKEEPKPITKEASRDIPQAPVSSNDKKDEESSSDSESSSSYSSSSSSSADSIVRRSRTNTPKETPQTNHTPAPAPVVVPVPVTQQPSTESTSSSSSSGPELQPVAVPPPKEAPKEEAKPAKRAPEDESTDSSSSSDDESSSSESD